jgi:dihydrodipicolinate synthase/N-acetylneuraminate lyase
MSDLGAEIRRTASHQQLGADAMQTSGPLSGVVVAAVTPLDDGGRGVDLAAVPRLLEFYAASGASGVLPGGTTGEGLLLTTSERLALAESYVEAAPDGFAVVSHVGAMTTAEAVQLARHARDIGAAAAAAVAPPYYPYDEAEVLAHFRAIADACAPVPFYAYEFRERAGYAIPVSVVSKLRDQAPNFVGMKVSDREIDEVRQYLLPGVDVLVGSEPLIPDMLALGAVGTVSGLAASFPTAVVDVLQGRQPAEHVAALRRALAAYPVQAALKAVLVANGMLDRGAMRPPLRELTEQEHSELNASLAELQTTANPTG